MKRLTDIDRGVGRYYESISPLVESPKLGPILWQLSDAFRRDDDRRRQPTPEVLTTDWTYLRFHYGRRGHRGNYSERELREWAARVRELTGSAEVFAYFNNDWEVFAPRNAERLRKLASGG